MKLKSLVCALAFAISAPAMAATFNLGAINSPSLTFFGNTFRSNQHFTDTYNFSLSESSFVAAGATATLDLNIFRDLNVTSVTLLGGGQTTSYQGGGVGASFSNLLAGAYQLVVTGDVTGIFGKASYEGAILTLPSQLSAPVPEPETFGMLAFGLAAVGFVARRRKQK
jgi:hypothetical protein